MSNFPTSYFPLCYSMDINIYTENLLVCNSGQPTYVTGLFNFFFVLQDLIDRIDSYSREQLFRGTCFLLASNNLCRRRHYGRKWLVSIKHQNLHSFKEALIPLCQSTLERRRVAYFHGSSHFTIPLSLKVFFE